MFLKMKMVTISQVIQDHISTQVNPKMKKTKKMMNEFNDFDVSDTKNIVLSGNLQKFLKFYEILQSFDGIF